MSEAMKKELQEGFEKGLPALKSGRRPNISVSASVKSLKPSGLD
jgi:hypothetical protein